MIKVLKAGRTRAAGQRRRKSRLIVTGVALTAAIAMAGTLGTAAASASSAPQGTRVTAPAKIIPDDGSLPSAHAPAQATPDTGLPNVTGFNGNVEIDTWATGLHVSEVLGTWHGTEWFGHIHIYDTANGYSVNGPDMSNPTLKVFPNRDFSNQSLMCVEGWEKTSHGYVLEGRPCETIHA